MIVTVIAMFMMQLTMIQIIDMISMRNPLVPAINMIASALYRLYPEEFNLEKTLHMVGSRKAVQSVKDGVDPKIIARQWQKDLDRFKKLRSRYLLY
jgi:uncharacterized protein YbbC (DUF1343 family)